MTSSTVTIPQTHRAWTFTRKGHPSDVLAITPDYPTPQPSTLKVDEALIKVSAVALNAGYILAVKSAPHPTSHKWIPEMEFAGTIVALGPRGVDKQGFQIGDRVMGGRSIPDMLRNNGTAQEFLVASLSLVARAPSNTTEVEAAGLVGVGCTAIQATSVAGIKRGDKVFITGASSGLGTILIQVVRAIVGETGVVVATCSGKNSELVKSLGADEVIDYTKHSPVENYLKEHHSSTPFNAIFDIIYDSNRMFTESPAYLTKTGQYTLLGAIKIAKDAGLLSLLFAMIKTNINRIRPVFLGGTPRRFLFYSAAPNQKDAKEVADLVEQGKVKPVVDSVWKFEQLKEAYERLMSQRARGKVIVSMELSA